MPPKGGIFTHVLWLTNGALVDDAPLLTIFFQFFLEFFFQNFLQYFFPFFLNLESLWLNLGSICLISGQITLHGQTSQKVTHPHTTPAQARLTL